MTLSFDKEFLNEEISGKVGATDFSLEFTEYNLDVRTSYYDGEGDEIKQKITRKSPTSHIPKAMTTRT